jgi:hypothetical protein
MKKYHLGLLGLVAICVTFALRLLAAEPQSGPRQEYATIRWAGPENTHIIRPGGQVEFIGAELRKMQKPDRADNRSFYMNAAMNGLNKEGYEFAGMWNDDIIMKRAAAR